MAGTGGHIVTVGLLGGGASSSLPMAGVVGTSLLVAEGWVLGWSPSSPLMARGDGRVIIVTGVVLVAIVNAGVGVIVIVCGAVIDDGDGGRRSERQQC